MPALHELVDHTLLKKEATRDEVTALVAEAKQYHFNSICVRPNFIAEFASSYRVSAVIGFPQDFINCEAIDGVITDAHDLKRARDIISAPSMASKVVEARLALEAGALELDPVINVNDLFATTDMQIVYPVFSQNQDLKRFADAIVPETRLGFPGDKLRKEIQIYLFLLREFIREDTHLSLKPIFSCETLSDTELELSIQIFSEEVIGFFEQFPELIGRISCSYKNSTGFIKASSGINLATPELISKIALELDKHDPEKTIGIKAAGGIRDIAAAEAVSAAANGRLTHIGTSAGIALATSTVSSSQY